MRFGVRADAAGELPYLAANADATHLVGGRLGEPEASVRSGRQPQRIRCDAAGEQRDPPFGVIRPICSPDTAVNHRFPSRPMTISHGAIPVGRSKVRTRPVALIRPTLPPDGWVNQTASSGPGVRNIGAWSRPRENSVIRPLGLMRPIRETPISLNHKFPSVPVVMNCGSCSRVIPRGTS